MELVDGAEVPERWRPTLVIWRRLSGMGPGEASVGYWAGLLGLRAGRANGASGRARARFAAVSEALALLAESRRSGEPVLANVREQVEPVMTQLGPIEAGIIDDTSFPKQGSIPSRCCSHPMEDVVPYGGDAEPLAMNSIHAAIAPRWPGEPGVPSCRPAPAIDAKNDEPADLPQVACGGSYL
jgi:hypothetical protein